MNVSELMQKDVVVAYEGDSVQHLSEEMAKSKHGLAVVINNVEEKKVRGVVSNKDIIERVVAAGLKPSHVGVKDIMIKEVISILPDASTSQAMQKMMEYNIKRIIVMENHVLQGIISSNDIVKGMLKYKKKLLDMAIDF